MDDVCHFLPIAIDWLELPIKSEGVDVSQALTFFELTESNWTQIDLITRGPVHMLLPFGEDRLFIDYARIPDFLFNLFFDVVPSDQNFKGDALEILVRQGSSILPVGPCKSLNGEERQVDASFELGDALIIVECRVFARSFGIEIGDPKSITFRTEKIDAALNNVDAKATWLSNNPKGRNYDISRFSRILPLAVTPFVEFIPSSSPRYWITKNIPRILTPHELQDNLENGTLKDATTTSPNVVYLHI